MSVMHAFHLEAAGPDGDAGPAELRLHLLEMMMRHDPLFNGDGTDQRLVDIQRTMAGRPSASLADVLAKLRTARMSGLRTDWADRLDLQLIESAIADLERLPAL